MGHEHKDFIRDLILIISATIGIGIHYQSFWLGIVIFSLMTMLSNIRSDLDDIKNNK